MYITTNHLKPPAPESNGYDFRDLFLCAFLNSSETLKTHCKSLTEDDRYNMWDNKQILQLKVVGYYSTDTEANRLSLAQSIHPVFILIFFIIIIIITILFLRCLGLLFVLVPLFFFFFDFVVFISLSQLSDPLNYVKCLCVVSKISVESIKKLRIDVTHNNPQMYPFFWPPI